MEPVISPASICSNFLKASFAISEFEKYSQIAFTEISANQLFDKKLIGTYAP